MSRFRTGLLGIVCGVAALPAHALSLAAQKCAPAAANHYGVDVRLVRAVLAQENCPETHVLTNRNSSYDIGAMCINSIHLPELAKNRITERQLLTDGCLNVSIGTWMLRRELVRTKGDVWRAIGNYHSATPRKNYEYQQLIWKRYLAILRSDTGRSFAKSTAVVTP